MNDLLNYNPNLKFDDFPSDDLVLNLDENNINEFNVELSDVIPAIPTLYLNDGSVDYIELEKMLEKQSKAGIENVLIAGTTGESTFLNDKEHIEYIEKSVNIAKKYGIQVVAGTGSNSTREQNIITESAFEKGAVASLLLPPYYIKCSDADLITHLTRGLNYGPGIIYSISGRASMEISNDVIKILSKHPNFLGVKECDGGEKIEGLKRMGIRVWTGNDNESFLNIHKNNADGAISVICNIDPELILEVKEGIGMTKSKIDRLLTLSHLMFLPGQPNPKPIHNAIEMIRRNIDSTAPVVFRGPGGPLSISQQKYLSNGLNELGINSNPFGNNYKVL